MLPNCSHAHLLHCLCKWQRTDITGLSPGPHLLHVLVSREQGTRTQELHRSDQLDPVPVVCAGNGCFPHHIWLYHLCQLPVEPPPRFLPDPREYSWPLAAMCQGAPPWRSTSLAETVPASLLGPGHHGSQYFLPQPLDPTMGLQGQGLPSGGPSWGGMMESESSKPSTHITAWQPSWGGAGAPGTRKGLFLGFNTARL